MPKKRKGAAKKGPSPEGVVVSATTRRPEEGSIEENELGQLPGPVPWARAVGTSGEPSRGLPDSGPGVGKEEPNPPGELCAIRSTARIGVVANASTGLFGQGVRDRIPPDWRSWLGA